MQLGQPKHLTDNMKDGGGLSRIRLEEGANVHRILYGPMKISLQYYPVLIEDEDGGMQQRMKVIRRDPSQGTPLDVLASLEKRVRKERGETNPSSSLNPSTKWLYKVIDRSDPDYPAVKICEYPYTVWKGLAEVEKARSTKDTDKLRYGLIFMWDCIITKSVDKSKGIRFGTSYAVEVDPENEYAGKVPASYLGATSAQLEEKGVDCSKFFTKEEWAAIEADQENGMDLEKIGEAESAEDIASKLAEFPIFLGATNQDGSYRFPDVDRFKAQLSKQGLDYLDAGAEDKPIPKRLEEIKTTEVKSKTEDIVFEEEAAEKVETKKVETKTTESEKPKAEKAKAEKPKTEKAKVEPVESTDEDEDEDFPEW